jgi:hypothetical protein
MEDHRLSLVGVQQRKALSERSERRVSVIDRLVENQPEQPVATLERHVVNDRYAWNPLQAIPDFAARRGKRCGDCQRALRPERHFASRQATVADNCRKAVAVLRAHQQEGPVGVVATESGGKRGTIDAVGYATSNAPGKSASVSMSVRSTSAAAR